jgi:hypothetical protein
VPGGAETLERLVPVARRIDDETLALERLGQFPPPGPVGIGQEQDDPGVAFAHLGAKDPRVDRQGSDVQVNGRCLRNERLTDVTAQAAGGARQRAKAEAEGKRKARQRRDEG